MKAYTRYAAQIMLMLILLLALSAPAQAEENPELRVLLSSAGPAEQFSVSVIAGEYALLESGGAELAWAEKGDTLVFAYSGNRYQVSVNNEDYSSRQILTLKPEDEDARFRLNGVTFRGSFQAAAGNGYLYAVNMLGVEEYLYGVVGRELGYNYHAEATKAQAVASRSYALASLNNNNQYYDLTNTISSQVYGGADAETAHIRRAVDDTRGMVLLYQGAVVSANFCSNAGGHTENIGNVWMSDAVPIQGVPSPFDAYAGNYSGYGASCYSWAVEYTPADLVRLANQYGQTNIGEYVGISMSTIYKDQRSVSGRAMSVSIIGTKGTVSATKDAIRGLLDIKSTLISISDNTAAPAAAYVLGAGNQLVAWESLDELYAAYGDSPMRVNPGKDSIFVRSASGLSELSKKAARNNKIVISGKGYGHGVGMSQWGAIAMADFGYDWQEIIEHYYCGGGIRIGQY